MGTNDGERGQSTVELALVLPFLVVFVIGIVQIGSVVRAQINAAHAAREAARVLVVDPRADALAAVQAAGTLEPSRLRVSVSGRRASGGLVTVHVRYRVPVVVPLLGRIATPTVHEKVTMRVE